MVSLISTAAIFDSRTEARLDEDEERATILRAQAGDQDAKLTLLAAYAPALRNSVAWYVRAIPTAPTPEDLEDVRTALMIGLLESVDAFDPTVHRRLAAVVPGYLRNAVSTAAAGAIQFHVPERTLKRFFGVLRKADGDTARALEIAPEHQMKRETFLAVLDALRNVDSFDAIDGSDGDESHWARTTATVVSAADPIADVEDAIMVDAALASVGETERVVVGLAYGFADYEPVADAEIGERLGLSRPKVQRVRSGALGKMRDALGVA